MTISRVHGDQGVVMEAKATVCTKHSQANTNWCDSCGEGFCPECIEDGEAWEGGDRNTSDGLVAHPDICPACVRVYLEAK